MNTNATRLHTLLHRAALPAVSVAVLTLAGCGMTGSSSATNVASDSGAPATTVSIHGTSDGQVLATSNGQTLYLSDQEKKQVLCKSSECVGIWAPLTVSPGQTPTAPAKLRSDIGTIKRPDGSSQVTFDGQPLYTFSFDHGAGQVNGNGQSDSFDGVDFTWHVARPTGATPAAPASPASPTSPASPSKSSGYGGYGY